MFFYIMEKMNSNVMIPKINKILLQWNKRNKTIFLKYYKLLNNMIFVFIHKSCNKELILIHHNINMEFTSLKLKLVIKCNIYKVFIDSDKYNNISYLAII